ncbi:IS110 family transposase, partial [Shigella flexneri]|uniref:IS110 family transposase n=1 Tax=Shigella flexneri TaxID=623 RepID=UPI002094595D
MTESSDYESVQVFIGVDVGKDTHHAVAINRSGKRLFDKALPNDENKLRSLISDLKQHGQILLVVDQPATIGALPVAVARSEGVLVGYLPGLAMRRIADLHAGEAKTDARNAAIIAEAARTLPHALRTLKLADEQIAELSMLCGFDDDLAAQTTQASNRIRGLLTQIHPAPERVLGPRLEHPAVLDLLQRYPSPEKLASLGEKKLAAQLCKLAPRLGKRLAADIAQALAEQTVVVPGTNAAAVVLPRLALQLICHHCRSCPYPASLSMLCGFDDDLAAQTTQASNRIRGLLTQIHPALERVLGPRLEHPAVLDLLQRYPSPEKLASLGEKKLAAQLCKLAPRLGKRLAAD